MMNKYGILGGGLCGVVLSTKLDNSITIEASSRPGGHCKTWIEKGYTYDIGGPHIIFSKNESILREMKSRLGDHLGYGIRDNRCYYKNQFVSYPFENGVSELPGELRFPFVRDFFHADRDGEPAKNLRSWLLQRFGPALAEEYLIPYNNKIWNIDSTNLTVDWVEGRIPMPSTDDMLEVACGLKTVGYAHQANFVYPKTGGIERLVEGYMTDTSVINTDECVIEIVRDSNLWSVKTKKNEYKFEHLISTIPILDLLNSLQNVPEAVIQSAQKLRFNSLINIAVGFKKNLDHTHTAVYLPQKEFLCHRISFPRNFSDHNAPAGNELVNIEITTNYDDDVYNLSDDKFYEAAVRVLKALGYLENQKLEYFRVHKSKYAYVVRDQNYLSELGSVLDFISKTGITSLGRNAEFEYINMDEAIRRTNVVAKKLITDFGQ